MAEDIGVNLLENSSFDQDLDGWGTFTPEGSSREVIWGPHGSKALRISRSNYSGSTRTGVHRKPTIDKVTSGEEFVLSAMVRVDSAPQDFSNNAIFMRNGANGDNPKISIPNDAEVGKWIQYSKAYIANTDANVDDFYILLGKNGAFSVSEIKLERGGYRLRGLQLRRILNLW